MQAGSWAYGRIGVGGFFVAVTVGSMWLPWAQFGGVGKSSFAIFEAAQFATMFPTSPQAIAGARFLWMLSPFALVAGFILLSAGIHRAGMALLLSAACYISVGGAATLLTSGINKGNLLAVIGATSCVAVGWRPAQLTKYFSNSELRTNSGQ